MTDEPKPQPEKFRDLARQLECDEDEATFEDQVRRIAKPIRGHTPPAEE
ncbi:hypothetical protein GCM10010983_12500 [Caulobacter rhizosphaerae]|jgi:hypothetical protein|nr:hypothetical protein GCM10010983_12500 [Caulobacter rhizosphaerae]